MDLKAKRMNTENILSRLYKPCTFIKANTLSVQIPKNTEVVFIKTCSQQTDEMLRIA